MKSGIRRVCVFQVDPFFFFLLSGKWVGLLVFFMSDCCRPASAAFNNATMLKRFAHFDKVVITSLVHLQ